MRTKIYLNDWFYNCGIIGFLKILEHDEKQFAVKRNNYIEIDTEDLRDFNKCYFKYFFDIKSARNGIVSLYISDAFAFNNIIQQHRLKCKCFF